jgi:hypothetical protein
MKKQSLLLFAFDSCQSEESFGNEGMAILFDYFGTGSS